MILTEVTFDELFAAFGNPADVYGSKEFITLNAPKVEALKALVLYDLKQKPRLGILAGLRQGQWHVPFSAPFGTVYYNHPQALTTCMEFAEALQQSCQAPLHITLPPALYSPEMISRLSGAFMAFKCEAYADYNYAYDLTAEGDFASRLSANARNHYNRACREGFEIVMPATLPRAYAVIETNRCRRGYPLAMSLEALEATSRIVNIDSFVLAHEGVDVASAIVYTAAPGIAQVIYWGDIEGYGRKRPMNLLARVVFDHYRGAGYRWVDIGPSSSHGTPDPGLCTFKESLGCILSFKPTFVL